MGSVKTPREKAGVVAYRLMAGAGTLVLFVTSRKSKGSWVFPVGTVEKGETLEVAARRECAEESGYLVNIQVELPAMEVTEGKRRTRFTFFLATVSGEASQWETDREKGLILAALKKRHTCVAARGRNSG